MTRIAALILAPVFISGPGSAFAETSAKNLYGEHCASCHHPKRLGLTAPPLIPGLFSRSAKGRLPQIIRDGLPATRMPAFGGELSDEQIKLLAELIQEPAKELDWTFEDIRSSKIDIDEPGKVLRADIENITLVMERGTQSLVVLDGADFSELGRFHVGAVHGGPKFSYSLDRVYALARDGILTSYNLRALSAETRLKAGINSRSVAVSSGDKTVAVANYLPSNVVLFDKDLEPVGEIPLPGKAGGFYSLPSLKSFALSFREIPELWIIGESPPFEIEKRKLPEAFQDFSVSPVKPYIIGTKRGGDHMYIYDYMEDRILKKIPTSGLPHLASAAFYIHKGELFAGVNHIKKPAATIISLDRLDKVAEIPLPGAGFFVRTHHATPYLWIDTETERIALVNKDDFSDIRYLTPHEGRKAMHVEFTKEGARALVTIPGRGGEVVIYDAKTLEKINAIPFERPVGKYNATNKTYPGRSLAARKADGASAGKQVFDKYCMGCHHQVYEAFGPSFTRIARERGAARIKFHILSPEASAKTLGYKRNSMPRIKLSPEQLEAIVRYIKSFGQTGG